MKMTLWAKKPYRKIVAKILTQMLGTLVKAVITVFLIRVLGYNKIGNMITRMIMNIADKNWDDAQYIYIVYVRANIEYLMFGAFLIFFVLIFYAMVNQFMRYFDEITAGVDQLVAGGDKPFLMSPELSFMQEKLIQVRGQLDRAAQAEREAEQRKSDFVLYLAHDIRTPLTSVIGYLSLLQENVVLEKEVQEKYIRITWEKALRLQKLVEEFFNVTRLTFGQVSLHKQPVNLTYMMEQIADELYPQLQQRGMAIVRKMPETMGITADPDQLARVFLNLLRNAIAYGEKGTIEITGIAGMEQVQVSVSSLGEVPEEELERLFEKFYRRDPSRSSSGGAGLGLAIAKDIVRLHGGTITAMAREGRTIFTVSLPIRTRDS